MRFLFLLSAVFVVGLVLESPFFPHYAAPSTVIILLFVLEAMRRLQSWHPRGRPAGIFLSRAILPICAVMFVLRAAAGPLHIPLNGPITPGWSQADVQSFGRGNIERQLKQLPGKQLVVVRYIQSHEPFEEWVYNESNIDGSKVVWAREMDPVENQKLLAYFKDRQAWLLEADAKPAKLSEYSVP